MTSLAMTSGDAVAKEINERWGRFEWSKVTLWSAIGLAVLGFGIPLLLIASMLLGAATLYLRSVEKREKTITLFYQLDPVADQAYSNVLAFLDRLSASDQLWSVYTSMRTNDWKRNAGASNLIQRKPLLLSKEPPRLLETNLPVYALTTGTHRLYFLPDRLLVQSGGTVATVAYHRLSVSGGRTRFIEDGRVPRDAAIVGQTWQYVNKSGGPDRRYNNNRQLPICLFGQIRLESQPGLLLEIQCSNPEVPDVAQEAFSRLAALSGRLRIE